MKIKGKSTGANLLVAVDKAVLRNLSLARGRTQHCIMRTQKQRPLWIHWIGMDTIQRWTGTVT